MRRPATIIWGLRETRAMMRPIRLIDQTPTRLTMRKIAPMKPMNTAMPIAVPRFIARVPTVSHRTRRTRPMIGPTALTRPAWLRRATPRGVIATLRMASHEDRAARRIMASPSTRRATTPTHISDTPIGCPWKDRAPHAGSVTAYRIEPTTTPTAANTQVSRMQASFVFPGARPTRRRTARSRSRRLMPRRAAAAPIEMMGTMSRVAAKYASIT